MPLFKSDVERHIEQLEQEIMSWLEEVWPASTCDPSRHSHPGWSLVRSSKQPYYSYVTNSVERLVARFGADDVGVMAADMYFNAVRWVDKHEQSRRDPWSLLMRLFGILSACIVQHQPPDLLERIEARLRWMLKDPYDRSEGALNYFYEPNIDDCMVLLTTLPPTPETIAFIESLLRGDFDYECEFLEQMKAHSDYRLPYFHDALKDVMRYLALHNCLPYSLFRETMLRIPRLMFWFVGHHWQEIGRTPEVLAQMGEYHKRLLDEVTHNLTPDNYELILESDARFSGGDYLLLAARYHEQYKLKTLTPAVLFTGNLKDAVVCMARAKDIESGSDVDIAGLIGKLKAFSAASLKHLLPVAPHGRRVLLDALGWEAAKPLVDFITSTAHHAYEGSYGSAQGDIPNTPDSTSGVIDVAAGKAALAEAGDSLAREILTLFSPDKSGYAHTAMLLEALAGWNRDKVEKSFLKHSQIAIKAYGLLPLEDENAALERYLALRDSAKEGKKFGAQRRLSHAAAVQAAITNLSQVAGYSTAGRFEWEMEAKLAEEAAAPGRTWTVGEYELRLASDGVEASLEFSRGGKSLKTPPQNVRASTAYKEAREAVTRVRQQASRFRSEFVERLVASGELLPPDEVRRLLRLPAARAMLQRMIFQTEDGIFGLLDAEAFALRGMDGALTQLAQPARLAHPYHLYEAGVLAAWQREIVHRRIVQPVKQAFRELYVLTPAERNTRTYSNRFAGHTIRGEVAARLLGGRGWHIPSGEGVTPFKAFPGLRAYLSLPDAYYFLGGQNPITTDQIYFEPHPLSRNAKSQQDDYYVALDDIPPLIFSEVMRDIDLVVAVAQASNNGLSQSQEMFARRADLVTALLDDLGLLGVTVDGHFAHIKGKLANYRIHLGSAVIHIEPGNYLCIVPDRWGKTHDRLFLPFADENDSKTSEVISKILLLVNDDKIKDESILRQIGQK